MPAIPGHDFVNLISDHVRLLHKICAVYAADAEDRRDLFQEIVLQAWKAYPRFKGASQVTTWLYRIGLNTAISHQRKASSRPRITHNEDVIIQLADSGADDSDAFLQLRQVIVQLPELERALLLLHLEDRSHAEIAGIMGISVSNVGTRLQRIREKLKKLMQTA